MEIKRDIYLKKIISSMHNGMIKIITGIRRCGKSYLLFEIFCNYLKNSGVDDSHIIKIDLENRRNLDLRDPDKLLAFIDGNMVDQDMYYILIDEIQHVREFEDVLNSYLKIKNADVYVTGSNSRFLSKDVITEFRGRGDEIRVHPLCFSEFSTVCGESDQRKVLEEYLTFGGLPQVVLYEDVEKKEDFLKKLFQTAYLNDIKERYNMRNDEEIEAIIDVLASGVGSLTNPLKLQNTFKSVKNADVTSHTIKRYMDMLQDAFILEKSLKYDIKGRRYIDTPSKYYFEDLGLRNARLNFRQANEGHLIENMIYNELRLRGYSVDVGQVTYNYKDEQGRSQRSNYEVDFVCNRGFRRYYIQSAASIPTREKMAQETMSLRHIGDNFQKILIVSTMTPMYQNDDGIIVMNIYDFLKSENCLMPFGTI